jgi:hypothetical protein
MATQATSTERKDLYKYQAIPAGSIRLINFEQRTSSEPCCTLTSVHLAEAEPYSALSYAWDDCGVYETLLCHGGVVTITPNCKAAITRLAERSNHRMRLWIDAVCINQLDSNEVDAQLAIACDIYKRADTTWVWLGEGQDGGDYCLRAVSDTVLSGSCRVIRNGKYDVGKQFELRTVMALVCFYRCGHHGQRANIIKGSHLATAFMAPSSPPFMVRRLLVPD